MVQNNAVVFECRYDVIHNYAIGHNEYLIYTLSHSQLAMYRSSCIFAEIFVKICMYIILGDMQENEISTSKMNVCV